MINSKINWGILATGKIAHKLADDFRQVTNGQIVAVASRTQEQANAFAKQYHLAQAYDSYAKLADDPNIDIIYVATPHNSHYKNTLMCLQHKKPVLCEKPFTVNAQQLRHLITAAKEHHVFLMEALWTYFMPAVLKALAWVNAGKIGKLLGIQATFGFKAKYDPRSRLFNLNYAGGTLLDVGVYGVAFSELIMSDVITAVTAQAAIGKTGVDEYIAITLRYRNNAITQITSSLVADLHNDGIIYGEKGYIRLPHFWRASRAELITSSGIEIFEEPRTTHGYNYMITAVNQMLLNKEKESASLPLLRSLKNMETMDKIRNVIGLCYPGE